MSDPANRPEQVHGELIRTPQGTFAKGKSGNPSGRPRMSPEVAALLASTTMDSINELIRIRNNAMRTYVVGKGDAAQVVSVPDDSLRMAAANSLLDRSIGKPMQALAFEPGDTGETPIVIPVVILPTGPKP